MLRSCRLIAATIAALLILPSWTHAQEARTFQALTVSTTAVRLADATRAVGPTHMTVCQMVVETAEVRYRIDGGAPTSAIGTLVVVGDTIVLGSGNDIDRFQAIRSGAVDGTLTITCSVGSLSGQEARTFESLTVSTTALRLANATRMTGTTPVASCTTIVETAAVRYRIDGGAPTAAVGLPVEPGQAIVLTSINDLSQFQVIRRDGTNATLHVTCFVSPTPHEPIRHVRTRLDPWAGAPITATRLTVSDGGTVTQITSITTGVTLNTTTGQITTVSSTLAAGAEAEFIVTNSTVAATSVVLASIASTSSAGVPQVVVSRIAAGSFTILLSNLDAAAALNNTLVINFIVFGGSAT